MPYVKDAHSKEFGGPRDYYNCTERFYIITYKPTKADIKSVTGSKYHNHCLLIPSSHTCGNTPSPMQTLVEMNLLSSLQSLDAFFYIRINVMPQGAWKYIATPRP